MCLSTVYKNTMEPAAVLMRNVMHIQIEPGKVVLTDLMERQLTVEGTLREANLVDGFVIIDQAE